MVKINENYLLLQNSYLFVEVNRRAAKYMEENPDKNVIKMGIGDVTKPLVPTVIKAFKDAVDEMAEADSLIHSWDMVLNKDMTFWLKLSLKMISINGEWI